MSQLASLLTLTKSRMKAQEFLLLLADKKKVLRQGYYETESDGVLAFCLQLGIAVVGSDFAIESKDFNTGVLGQSGMRFLYFSKSKELAQSAKEAESLRDDKKLGDLLGYPPCCIAYFLSSFSADHTNLELVPTCWETNLSHREDDWCLLSHFPCTSECKVSVSLAQDFFSCIEADDATWGDDLKFHLEKF